ncbi:MAG: leucine-rich repeat protein [Clostridiales bacterium]|jgi:hypothetical protein|nr:leucine-rich repeat protein [Clostridiales bacterium]
MDESRNKEFSRFFIKRLLPAFAVIAVSLIAMCSCEFLKGIFNPEKNAKEPAKYAVTYIMNGGTNNADNPTEYTEEDGITLKDPTQKVCVFKGWREDGKFVSGIEKGSAGNKTFTAEWELADSFEYGLEFEDTAADSYEVTDYNGKAADVIIPSMYYGKPVTGIGSFAFSSCKSLSGIVIPNSVKNIGSNAFNGCWSLSIVAIPDGVESIGANAFYEAGIWNNAGRGVVYADKWAVGYKEDGRTDITLKAETVGIASNVFYRFETLRSIEIPNGVKRIGAKAFAYCPELTIYCEADGAQGGWDSAWNYSNRPVIWGYRK